MAGFTRLESGNWRVQVRRKNSYVSETFRRHADAQKWALEMERKIDQGRTPTRRSISDPTTVGDLIDLHVNDMLEVGKPMRRSKSFVMESLKTQLGNVKLKELTRERLVQFGKDRSKQGAGPVTISMDIGYLKLIVSHAAAVHGIDISPEPVDMSRIALKRLGLIGKSRERDRRPTPKELARLFDYFDNNKRLTLPMTRICKFAIASAMRQEEICRIEWKDVDAAGKTVLVRDRKDPRDKVGNHVKVPLISASGYDAWVLLAEQRLIGRMEPNCFPYFSRSVGTAFRRACRELKIEDLHFHDLRHEAASRLFEVGFRIEQVALVTGHKDWKMLRRYTNLKPEHVHQVSANLGGVRWSVDRVG